MLSISPSTVRRVLPAAPAQEEIHIQLIEVSAETSSQYLSLSRRQSTGPSPPSRSRMRSSYLRTAQRLYLYSRLILGIRPDLDNPIALDAHSVVVIGELDGTVAAMTALTDPVKGLGIKDVE